MSRRSTLDKPLCALATAKEEHADMLDLAQLIQQLWHHHVSQTKPQTGACSKEYNQELADRLAYHLGYRSIMPELKFQAGGRTKTPLGKLSDAMALQEKVTTSFTIGVLKPWLKHLDSCAVHKRGFVSKATEAKLCNCGLAKAIAQREETAHEHRC